MTARGSQARKARRMQTRLTLAAALALGLGVAHAEVTVSQPWARATPGASQTGAAYMTLTASGSPDKLTGLSTPAAGMAELHVSEMKNGVMTMRPAGPLTLEPGKPLVLAPGGLHVMLMDLHKPLRAGDHLPLTLTFAHAPPVTVQVDIKPAGVRGP